MRAILLLTTCVFLSSCWMMRAYKVRHMQLSDHEKLPSVTISKSDTPYYFIKNEKQDRRLARYIDTLLSGTETAAFLVIRNDSILYEKYFMGFHQNSILPSNSMAKSFTGTLAGIALWEGKIASFDEPITNYLPELNKRDDRFTNITVRHLLDMRSGLDFEEGSYDIDDDAIKMGFRMNLEKHLLRVKIAEPPGNFKYQSVNNQLVGLIVQRATDKKLQDYFEEKIWMPMGAENDATWNVDSKRKKQVLISAAINATARDFAKFGRLYINNGWHNGRQVIDNEWIATVCNTDTMDIHDGYKYCFWNKRIPVSRNNNFKQASFGSQSSTQRDRHSYEMNYTAEAFNAFGFMEQIIYIHPRKNLIIVRLGRSWPNPPIFTQKIYDLGERL